MSEVMIQVETVRSKAFGLDARTTKTLKSQLSYEVENSQFSHAYRSGWSGRKYLFNVNNNTFPTGLLHRFTTILDDLGVPYRVVDVRDKPKIDISQVVKNLGNYGITPRKYQVKGIDKGLKNNNMMFWWPTASGKTILFGGLIAAYDLPTLILVNRRDLVGQHYRFLKQSTKMKIGTISEGIWKPGYVTIALTQSLWSKRCKSKADEAHLKKFLSEIRYLIIDEAHHGEAKTFKKPANDCVNASVRHGFSGTPYNLNSDDMELESVTGPVLSKLTISYLVEEGFLSIPIITMHKYGSPNIGESHGPIFTRRG